MEKWVNEADRKNLFSSSTSKTAQEYVIVSSRNNENKSLLCGITDITKLEISFYSLVSLMMM